MLRRGAEERRLSLNTRYRVGVGRTVRGCDSRKNGKDHEHIPPV